MDPRPKATTGPQLNISDAPGVDANRPVDDPVPVESTPAMSSYYYVNSPEIHQPTLRRSKCIENGDGLDLQGPLEIDGHVKSGGSINFVGDFVVKEEIDAYGAISINGSVNSFGGIKAYGNIELNGYLGARDKIKGYGKLKVVGSLEGTELEIYGNLSISGHLRCRRLVVYGSLTLIGPSSTYTVDESEEVAGAKLRREQEADWDW
ncbi:hypothetical protein ACRE_001290 [Hapsidospora chrysogenum ATCC 11550]|uniref:Uncharacterized protein n=1 Tax=Hapsidospora chrysogenum (strain ATCC 11550 / CBS 779.69 / DSM 880 / IAM 14645 / JCM 23072 / IMI 49137) TaxID=857340 RepID=A0A086TIB0_HAPC1|nr:hypothetical protein ACRE_001290 [Hapsidospora chrysogenum ATCC 11550]